LGSTQPAIDIQYFVDILYNFGLAEIPF